MAEKLSLVLTVTLCATLLVACSPAAPAVPAAPTEISQTPAPVECGGADCFQTPFLACASSVMKMPFGEGNFYTITVFGKESGLCHYSAGILDKDGKSIPGGPPSTDCRVPIEKLTKDTLGHFFGQGTESIKAEQDKIESDYCVVK
ncbi:MAG: hypothetical protein NTZ74_03050 [Chloroflexi bacterium]|nr:hypothetical protein [Chloroflexota bacterium]